MIKYYATQTVEDNICTYELKAVGHANYDEYGKDIICSAVSILVVTLVNKLYELNVRNLDIQLVPGDFMVKCQAHVCDFRVRDAISFAELGLHLISTEHPEHVVMEKI